MRETVPMRDARDELLGESPAWRSVLARLPLLVAGTRPALLVGATGTGKRALASVIHRHSARTLPMRIVACGAMADERALVEAIEGRRAGRESFPPVGTIVLAGIEDANPGVQSALVACCDAIVGRSEGPRLVVVSRRPLEPLVQQGVFRPELYFRVAARRLELPALRARGGDVVLLARSFIARAAGRRGVPAPTLSPELCERLQRYSWPGNVRELLDACETVVENAGSSLRLEVDHWPEPPWVERHVTSGLHAETTALEVRRLREALARTHGNKTQAARALGLSRQGFLQKLQRHGLGIRPTLDDDRAAD